MLAGDAAWFKAAWLHCCRCQNHVFVRSRAFTARRTCVCRTYELLCCAGHYSGALCRRRWRGRRRIGKGASHTDATCMACEPCLGSVWPCALPRGRSAVAPLAPMTAGLALMARRRAGTLTENRMTVVEGWFSGRTYSSSPRKERLPADVAEEIVNNICLNSKAFYVEEEGQKTNFVGNRTECALLMLSQRDWDTPYDAVRKQHSAAVRNVRSEPCPICSRFGFTCAASARTLGLPRYPKPPQAVVELERSPVGCCKLRGSTGRQEEGACVSSQPRAWDSQAV